MKISIFVAVLILIAASFFGWKENGSLAAARQEHERLEKEARELGIDTAALAAGGDKAALAKNRRDNTQSKEADAKAFAAKLIAFAREMEEAQKQRTEPDENMQKRIIEIMDQMLSLDAAQLKVLLAEFRAAPDLTDEMRSGMIGFAVMMLANDHPAVALNLFSESSDLLKNGDMNTHVVGASLSKWAQDDPKAAIEWMKKNAKAHPELVNEQTKLSILSGAARQDPRTAFALAKDLELEDGSSFGRSIAEGANTPEQRNAVLSAMHDYLKGLDEKASASMITSTMGSLAGKAMQDGYDAGSKWLDSAKLDDKEREAFANGIQYWQAKSDTGKWIEWLDGKLPAENLSNKVTSLVNQWTQQDYKAAGQWIDDCKAGPVKDSAVRSYASTVAPYAPDSAAQWALTLPEGKERSELLGNIHSEWKKKDADAAAKFARENGLAE
ncbi:hypothetical protein [Haloferula sp. BvORR071]|uniref:hypothetical protein n=1 Tax=Haloferula sp. BvORR071 TaxID=1396141 RepID=UPI00054D1C0C|nr:hypothetical protein [Haloferula sp. BvORR071]